MFAYYSSLSSEVYDLDKPIGHSFGDVEYYTERLKGCKGPILEPATGTGRILIPLLEQGFQVEGFDISTEMLEHCKRNCAERGLAPKLSIERMEAFKTDTRYEAIIIPTGTFLLLHERESSIRALQNFYDHLQDGGRLIVDLIFETDMELGKVSERFWESPNGDVLTVEHRKVKIDWIHQYSVAHNRYERWRDGKLVESELERMPIRWYGVEEFKAVLEKIGFTGITVSANYQYGEKPTNGNQLLSFEAIANK
ncbi:class I SAM-dependent methyltransferase [Planococcus sp. NCCP-2050]|uniref:class I SAM-dependent methyltransferase n=1 Tax=Planococcus sp. NCCP-2050 TaxID=2944679 RepID=UPI00203E0E41|nr:class I SAM-dependent methyltransferase [Planococcus sp. NCCP-2050]GKW47073.1 SAM-dependent methyltransferase [Planococcus sp. NCCP-2050]